MVCYARWTAVAALPKYLNDFADITEIGSLKPFRETREGALQVRDGADLGLAIDCEARTTGSNPQVPGQGGLTFREIHGGVKILFRPRTVAVTRAKLTANAQQFRHLPAIPLFGDCVDPCLY